VSEETKSMFNGHGSEIFRTAISICATILLGLLTYIGSSILDNFEELKRNNAQLVERLRISEITAIGTQSTLVGLVERVTRLEMARDRQAIELEWRNHR